MASSTAGKTVRRGYRDDRRGYRDDRRGYGDDRRGYGDDRRGYGDHCYGSAAWESEGQQKSQARCV
eukprot:768255-Hanusia_phi.AAC.4